MPLPALATADDAAAYGYTLPAGAEDTWLNRASVRIRRAAGWDITSATATFRATVEYDEVALPSPPVTAVSAVAAVNRDGTTTVLEQGKDWVWDGAERVQLLTYAERLDVTYTHGFATIPDSLIELTCEVAQRLSNTPVGMEAGIRSVTIDDYSRTFAAEARQDAACLLPGEQDALDDILPVPSVWVVKSR